MKRKIYLELGITLIVGFLIGFFVNSIITDKRIKDFSMHKGELSFWRRALTEVQASDEQKQEIMPIIRAYSEETREILHESWEQIPPIWEEMEKEIMQHLTKEQQAQIEAKQAERKKHIRDNIKQGKNKERGQGQEYRDERRKDPNHEGKRPPEEKDRQEHKKLPQDSQENN